MDREPELLSVVAPMFEEQDIVDTFTERVAAALEGIDYELILVDDGSKDRTAEAMARAAAADPRVKVVAAQRATSATSPRSPPGSTTRAAT